MRSMGGRLLNTTSRPLLVWCAVKWNPFAIRNTYSGRTCGQSGFAGSRCARYDLPNVDHVGRPQTAPMAVNHALDLSDASDRFTWSPHWRRHGQRNRYRSELGTLHCCFESFTLVGRCWNDLFFGDMIAFDSVDTLCQDSVQSFHQPNRFIQLIFAALLPNRRVMATRAHPR